MKQASEWLEMTKTDGYSKCKCEHYESILSCKILRIRIIYTNVQPQSCKTAKVKNPDPPSTFSNNSVSFFQQTCVHSTQFLLIYQKHAMFSLSLSIQDNKYREISLEYSHEFSTNIPKILNNLGCLVNFRNKQHVFQRLLKLWLDLLSSNVLLPYHHFIKDFNR